jgi:hypothetical protein
MEAGEVEIYEERCRWLCWQSTFKYMNPTLRLKHGGAESPSSWLSTEPALKLGQWLANLEPTRCLDQQDSMWRMDRLLLWAIPPPIPQPFCASRRSPQYWSSWLMPREWWGCCPLEVYIVHLVGLVVPWGNSRCLPCFWPPGSSSFLMQHLLEDLKCAGSLTLARPLRKSLWSHWLTTEIM